MRKNVSTIIIVLIIVAIAIAFFVFDLSQFFTLAKLKAQQQAFGIYYSSFAPLNGG